VSNLNRKKRILSVGEASFVLSGFGKYGNEVLKRLQNTGKYEIAELSCYGFVNDQRANQIPWTYYANAISDDDPRKPEYDSNPENQWGAWRFERTMLDFRPDLVMSIRDPWMDSYIFQSPFRKFFNYVVMPTYDSKPYAESWVYDYSTADAVFTYTEWAEKELNNDANGKINIIGTASPGVDLDIFKPVNNIKQHRNNMGFREDIFLIGSVMRNQKRKLFPDLLKAFKIFLQKCHEKGRDDIAQKTFLYFHTSYPDRGWNFPDLLKKEGLGHKVVFTYVCQTCKNPFCSFFQDARTVCPHCKQVGAVLPSVGIGLTQEQLASIFQMFDCYVQYAIAGGIEMPAIEAGACGVVPFEVDYAGMSSAVRNLNGIPIKIKHKFLELETGAYRVYPDNDYLAEQLFSFLTKPESIRKKMGHETRKGAEKHYNWDNIAKSWEDYFDNTELTGLQGQWDSPPKLHNIPSIIPADLSNKDFVRWIFTDVLHAPDKINSYAELDMLKSVNYGVQVNGQNLQKITREQIFQSLINRMQQHYQCEQGRCGMLPLTQEDYINYAHERFTV
jgi:glycosyltransferase involved in cell wall biosynthesis